MDVEEAVGIHQEMRSDLREEIYEAVRLPLTDRKGIPNYLTQTTAPFFQGDVERAKTFLKDLRDSEAIQKLTDKGDTADKKILNSLFALLSEQVIEPLDKVHAATHLLNEIDSNDPHATQNLRLNMARDVAQGSHGKEWNQQWDKMKVAGARATILGFAKTLLVDYVDGKAQDLVESQVFLVGDFNQTDAVWVSADYPIQYVTFTGEPYAYFSAKPNGKRSTLTINYTGIPESPRVEIDTYDSIGSGHISGDFSSILVEQQNKAFNLATEGLFKQTLRYIGEDGDIPKDPRFRHRSVSDSLTQLPSGAGVVKLAQELKLV